MKSNNYEDDAFGRKLENSQAAENERIRKFVAEVRAKELKEAELIARGGGKNK